MIAGAGCKRRDETRGQFAVCEWGRKTTDETEAELCSEMRKLDIPYVLSVFKQSIV